MSEHRRGVKYVPLSGDRRPCADNQDGGGVVSDVSSMSPPGGSDGCLLPVMGSTSSSLRFLWAVFPVSLDLPAVSKMTYNSLLLLFTTHSRQMNWFVLV